jgi:hypothetical protein
MKTKEKRGQGETETRKRRVNRLIRWNGEQNDHGTTSPEPPSLCTTNISCRNVNSAVSSTTILPK